MSTHDDHKEAQRQRALQDLERLKHEGGGFGGNLEAGFAMWQKYFAPSQNKSDVTPRLRLMIGIARTVFVLGAIVLVLNYL